jgi:2-iminobutanoate/2-iminopropanoate deaminase
MPKKIVSTPKAPKAIGPYSQAVKVGKFIFVSGQIPMNPETGKIMRGDVGDQTDRALQNLQAVLRAAKASLSQVVKCTVFLADMDDFAVMNEIYGQFFAEDPPARATVEVARLPKGVGVEIEAIAYTG